MLIFWCGLCHLQNFPLSLEQVDGAGDMLSAVTSELSSSRLVMQQEASATQVGVGFRVWCSGGRVSSGSRRLSSIGAG